MPQLLQCPNGHYYDPSMYMSCPYCVLPSYSFRKTIPINALLHGTLLCQRYSIVATIGSGGFAYTYLATDNVLEISVLIKECFPSELASRAPDGIGVCVSLEAKGRFEAFKRDFYKEANILMRCLLEHSPHFCNVFSENNTVYLVTEYVKGMSLKQYMDSDGGRLDRAKAKEFLLPLLDDLDKLHESGYLHRDIAPDNLLISDDKDAAMLIDFGAACRQGEEKDPSYVVLKHGFAPPEQYARDGQEGPWTDMYAFAATFYYAVTGKVPPEAISRFDEDKLLPPGRLGVQLGAQIEDALLRMLSLSTEGRCSAMQDFRRALSNTNYPSYPSIPVGGLSDFSAEPFASTCALMPMDERPEPKGSPPIPVPQLKAGGSAVGVGGLFSKLLSRKRNQKNTEAKPSPCSEAFGNTGAINMAGSPEAEPLRTADVEFSALFPKRFIKGEYSILEMYIYERDQREILDEALRAANAALKESRGSTLRIGEESVVSIRLECADASVQIEGNEECQIWHGKYLKFDFAIFLEESCPKRQLLFTATILINSVPATRLRFTAECSTLREQKLELLREDVLSAFVSYASQDRSRVATIIQGMKKARPEMDVFFDVDSLRSGEDWQQALRAEIERRDILFLCWSLSAKQSEWVDREWRYALENKGLGFIEPVPLDPPNICPPPKELSSKHFNDRGLLYINS